MKKNVRLLFKNTVAALLLVGGLLSAPTSAFASPSTNSEMSEFQSKRLNIRYQYDGDYHDSSREVFTINGTVYVPLKDMALIQGLDLSVKDRKLIDEKANFSLDIDADLIRLGNRSIKVDLRTLNNSFSISADSIKDVFGISYTYDSNARIMKVEKIEKVILPEEEDSVELKVFGVVIHDHDIIMTNGQKLFIKPEKLQKLFPKLQLSSDYKSYTFLLDGKVIILNLNDNTLNINGNLKVFKEGDLFLRKSSGVNINLEEIIKGLGFNLSYGSKGINVNKDSVSFSPETITSQLSTYKPLANSVAYASELEIPARMQAGKYYKTKVGSYIVPADAIPVYPELGLEGGYTSLSAGVSVITAINEARALQGLKPLRVDPSLQHIKNPDADPLLNTPFKNLIHYHLKEKGDLKHFKTRKSGEIMIKNASWVSRPDNLVDMWIKSDSHRIIMLSSTADSAGATVVFSTDGRVSVSVIINFDD